MTTFMIVMHFSYLYIIDIYISVIQCIKSDTIKMKSSSVSKAEKVIRRRSCMSCHFESSPSSSMIFLPDSFRKPTGYPLSYNDDYVC